MRLSGIPEGFNKKGDTSTSSVELLDDEWSVATEGDRGTEAGKKTRTTK